MSSKKLLLAGAGHGHLMLLKNLDQITAQGIEVTVISSDDYHYYSGMGPGLISGIYTPDECRFNVREMAERGGGLFLKGEIISVEPGSRRVTLSDGRKISYDAVSFNTGSMMKHPLDSPENGVFDVKPIKNMELIREYVISRNAVAGFRAGVIGGGFAGLECAFALRDLSAVLNLKSDITIIESGNLPGSDSGRFRKTVMSELQRCGINFIENSGPTSVDGKKLIYSRGERACDIIINASGIRPSSIFSKSGLSTDGEGALNVNRFLQSPDYPEIFGTGDCICFTGQPLRKVGVYAVRQNSIIYNNLISFLSGKKLIPFIPQKKFLKILNSGSGRGILYREPVVMKGRIPFLIKDYIDRSFMKSFKNY